MYNISVLDKVLKPGIVAIECPSGRFQHELPSPILAEGIVLDLASPLYHPSSRSKIYDRSGNLNHGTLIGATWVQLPSGLWVIHFDGVDDTVNMGDLAAFEFVGDVPFSGLAWINSTDMSSTTVLSKYTGAAGWYMFFDANDKLYVRLTDADGDRIGRLYNTALTAYEGTWILVGFTYDGSETSGGLKLCLNGRKIDDTDNNLLTYAGLGANVAELRVGSYGVAAAYANDFVGDIVLPRIFNIKLTAKQFMNIYQNERPLFGV